MIPADWTPHRREDGELLGWIRPEGADWLAVDVLGRELTGEIDWLDAEAAWPAEWVDQLGFGDTLLTVTADQLAAFQAELDALTEKYRRIGEGDPSARRVQLVVQSTPVDLEPPAQP